MNNPTQGRGDPVEPLLKAKRSILAAEEAISRQDWEAYKAALRAAEFHLVQSYWLIPGVEA